MSRRGGWPAQWRKHVEALNITGLALTFWMADRAKEQEFAQRISQALDEVEKVFQEVEDFMFDPEEDSCANYGRTRQPDLPIAHTSEQ